MDISHFKQKFIDEANTLLTNLDNILIELEKDSQNIQHVNEAFRTMHTIKGAGGMFGFERVVEITHELETLYDTVREKKIAVPQQLIDTTFTAIDHIRALLLDESFTIKENIEQHATLLHFIEVVNENFHLPLLKEKISTVKVKTNNVPEKIYSSWNIIFYPNDEIIKRAINLIYTFQDLFQLGEYKISNRPLQTDIEPYWEIILVTERPFADIEDTLMFISEYCKISKIADFNIFDKSQFEKRDNALIESTKNTNAIEKISETVSETVSDKIISEIIANEVKNEIIEETTEKTISSEVITNETETELLKNQHLSSSAKAPIMQVIQSHVTKHINVDSAKLDRLMYLVSELVTTKSELLLALQKENHDRALDAAEKIEKLSKMFSENALNIRLVSLQEMLHRFKRLIRDLSKQLDKAIDFVIVGEDTELDKTIIDNIGEPIMHLIRNCIDHGIENSTKRREKGKPEMGIIKFEAVKSGNFVFISISDDGNGIDTKYVYNKAVEKGFIAAGTKLSDKEIFDLIFLPGFSTAESLSNVSGRGVGMDIVLRKIQEIRGEVSITSEMCIGTKFTLKLQQTVSIIETLLIEADGYTYAIPVEDIDACMLEASKNIFDKQNKQIGYNGNLIPYINLRTQFRKITIKPMDLETEKLVIIKRLDKEYAIVADNIIGEYQAVIKPLGNAFANQKFLSGASLLGDGSIALLLDTDKLWDEIN